MGGNGKGAAYVGHAGDRAAMENIETILLLYQSTYATEIQGERARRSTYGP